MSRMFGTVVRGVRAPIFREGDDVVKGTVDTVLKALKEKMLSPLPNRWWPVPRATMPQWNRSQPM